MFSLEGLFDMHIHAFPDVTERLADDFETARRCKEAGMVGIAVKGMQESTTSRAYYVNKFLPDFRMVGGITLNYPVGGINPSAVDTCLRTGGRIVWMPTLQSRFHAGLKGKLGKGSGLLYYYNPRKAEGITVLDEKGELTEDCKEVISLIKEHNAVLATSHMSPEEILAMAAYCQREQVKCLVTHLGWCPQYDLELGKAALALGAHIELTAVTFGGYTHKRQIGECVQWIGEFGKDNIVLSTDAGAIRFAQPQEYLRTFGENLLANGVEEEDIRQMMSCNPLELIAE